MYARIESGSIMGVDGLPIEIEVDISNGLPSMVIVGLPETSVRESKERVQSAIKNQGFSLPQKKYRINLAPADIRKEGSLFDLPIALGILCALGHCDYTTFYRRIMVVGELSLEGNLRKVKGILPITIMARESGYEGIIVPFDNRFEAGAIEGIKVYPVKTLREALQFLNGEIDLQPFSEKRVSSHREDYGVDMQDVRGQEGAKRALEIAVAGGHNVLMVGPPGSGKTMLARRVPTIMPPMSLEESLETTRIYSVAGLVNGNIITTRPFRSPHHSISDVGLIGGGSRFSPGEVSLAHNGVLFLDEMPEFSRRALEVLRQPLEDGFVVISRAGYKVTIPARFMLIGAMNPCPCGYFGYEHQKCKCTISQIKNYQGRISGPLLDRIDIHIDVPSIPYEELQKRPPGETSSRIRERVIRARQIQERRFKGRPINSNAHMGEREIREFCKLDEAGHDLLAGAMERFGFSSRAVRRILKVSRTIADLDGSDRIRVHHLAEAINYRIVDKLSLTNIMFV